MKQLVIAGITAGALLNVSTANADVWDFSYSGIGYSGSDAFTTGATGSPYTVTGITGTANGSAITGLSSHGGADQTLNFPPTGRSYFDHGGISFAAASGVDYNIYYNTFEATDIIIATNDAGGFNAIVVSVTPAGFAVPEPASVALLGFSLASLGLIRRKYTNGGPSSP